MSADNWAICPRCEAKRQDDLRAREIDVANAYGTVSVDEFDALRAEFAALEMAVPPHTFREDYEFWGAEEGVVKANYRGSCSVCKLSHSFTVERPIDLGQSS